MRRLHFALGDGRVTFEVEGERLAQALQRPFAHLAIEPPEPADLRVQIWDEAETRRVWSEPEGDGFRHQVHGTRAYLDRRRGRLLAAVRDARALTDYELGRPLHQPLSLWLRDRGLVVVHAAMVAHERGGLLLAGPSGAGKTTTAHLGLRHGMQLLGEDLVILDSEGLGYSFYGSLYLGQGEAKALQFPVRGLGRSAPLRAVALPYVSDQEQTRWEPVPSSRAFLELGPSTALMGRARAGPPQLRMLADVLQRVPTYRVALGRDPESLMAELRRIF